MTTKAGGMTVDDDDSRSSAGVSVAGGDIGTQQARPVVQHGTERVRNREGVALNNANEIGHGDVEMALVGCMLTLTNCQNDFDGSELRLAAVLESLNHQQTKPVNFETDILQSDWQGIICKVRNGQG